MKFVNSWTSQNKQWDKFCFTLRIAFLTVFALKADFSKKSFNLTLLNFSLRTDD